LRIERTYYHKIVDHYAKAGQKFEPVFAHKNTKFLNRVRKELPPAVALEAAIMPAVSKDPRVANLVKKELMELFSDPELRALIEKLALKYNISTNQVKKGILIAIKTSIEEKV